MANYYYPSMTTVYSLFREPSLAFLWTHGCTFYVRPFPSVYLTTPTPRRTSWDILTRPLAVLAQGFGLHREGKRRAFPSRAAGFAIHFPRRPSWAILARLRSC